MTPRPAPDQDRVEAFATRVLEDTSATLVTAMAAIGDRLGLFKDLAAHGPATSAGLAARTGTQERYVREWLSALASAGYLEYDPLTTRFTLPSEHVPILAQEGGPHFFGGVQQETIGMVLPFNQVVRAFRQGGGVPQAAYDDNMWEGLERDTAVGFENLLLREWLPALPEVQARLARGAHVADVGCGGGRALIKLAQAFPRSRYVGYDAFAPAITRATANALAAGVAERVRFEARDAALGLPECYDVITTFDVVHDAVDPRGLLRTIRQALRPDGRYICLEIKCSERLEENAGPLGAYLYGCSVLYCLTTSLASGGAGLGTAGLPEPRLQELCREAGFRGVRRVPVDSALNSLFEISS